VTNPHSATDAATASRLVLRDTSGRTKVADPAADTDVDTQGARQRAIAAAVASGNWPNTLTAIAGCSGLSTVPQHYLRIGNKVSFAFVVTGTFGAGQNTFAFTLPVSSDFTLDTDLSGVACGDGSLLTSLVGAAYADTTNNRGIVSVYVGSAKTGTIVVSGMYGIK
jgi:hypothetical protein